MIFRVLKVLGGSWGPLGALLEALGRVLGSICANAGAKGETKGPGIDFGSHFGSQNGIVCIFVGCPRRVFFLRFWARFFLVALSLPLVCAMRAQGAHTHITP